MPTQCYSALIPAIALVLGSGVAIAPPAWSQTSRHYLSHVQGNVVVGRFLITPDPASNGMLVTTAHKIRLTGNSQVTLNCSNGVTQTFTRAGTYEVLNYCPEVNGTARDSRNSPRHAVDPALPYILSPRETALLETGPLTLQWNPVDGASAYTVSVTGPDVDWSQSTTQPQATYDDLEALRPNYRYLLEVTADTGKSEAVGFRVLDPAEIARVNDQIEAVQAQPLEPDAAAIASALVYLRYEHSDPAWDSGLIPYQAALEVLEERIQAGTENAQVYLLQAETYLRVGLPLVAQGRYEQALGLAQAAGQRELQAESRLGLAAVAEEQTEYGEAIRQTQAAQQLYAELGDLQQAEALQAQIDGWEQQL